MLEIGELTTLADYFVIATGSSNTQINALVDNVEKVLLEEAEEDPCTGRATVAARGCCWTTAASLSTSLTPRPVSSTGWRRLWRDGTPVDLTGVVDAKE